VRPFLAGAPEGDEEEEEDEDAAAPAESAAGGASSGRRKRKKGRLVAPTGPAPGAPPLRGVLLDVGGTLWPDRWATRAAPVVPGANPPGGLRETRLRDALTTAGLSPASAPMLLRALESPWPAPADPLANTTNRQIREILRTLGLPDGDDTVSVIRKAMCVPARGRIALFPGARDLLAAVRTLGLRCAVVTNATWRDGEDYRQDFADLEAPRRGGRVRVLGGRRVQQAASGGVRSRVGGDLVPAAGVRRDRQLRAQRHRARRCGGNARPAGRDRGAAAGIQRRARRGRLAGGSGGDPAGLGQPVTALTGARRRPSADAPPPR
jgi:hypothetical protein